MPQSLKTLSLNQFWSWKNSFFPLLALWGNKNWPPSMKLEKLKKFQNKSGLKGCKWPRLNGHGTEILLTHPLWGLEELPFPIIGLLGLQVGRILCSLFVLRLLLPGLRLMMDFGYE